jgi:hypothetical protein
MADAIVSPRPAASRPGHSPRQPALVIAAVALVVTCLGFAWTLGGHFLGDDFGYVARFYEYPLAQWHRLFVESWAGNMWGFQLRELRPVTAVSFMVDARVWGGNALGYRVMNLLLHAGTATLVGLIAWRAAQRDLTSALGAAALFALHPAHAEPVQWITGRVDVLATTFYLAGFLAFLRYREAGTRTALSAFAALYALAAFSKEFGLTLPLMCIAADLIWHSRWREWRRVATWVPYVASIAFVVVYFFCRRAAFGPGGMGAAFPDLKSAAFHAQFAQRQLTYLGHLFPPADRWLYEGATLLTGQPARNFLWIALVVIIALVAWRWTARHRAISERQATVFFSLGWYLVATLPLVVTYISPRHLYLASAGTCIALALLLRGITVRRGIFVVVAAGLSILYVQRLSKTMKPWIDAAVVSGQISQQLRQLEPELKPGAALFLDVPEITGGAYVWTWAVPFALRPPFTQTKLDEGRVVLESRGLYVDWDRWHEQPAIAALQQVQAESWVVQAAEGKPAHRIRVPADKVRVGGEHFAREPLKQFPHESWRKLINELTAP